MLKLDSRVSDVVASAVLVTGSARSGTTILGKLIHTYRNVEYSFEPPTLIGLFSLIDKMPLDSWSLLYEAYLAEDFFVNTMAGRSINTNRFDDSSIFSVKTNEEIDCRLKRAWSKADVYERAAQATIAYKLPNVVPYVEQLIHLFPLTRVVVLKRGAVETFHSLMVKGWFKDAGSQAATFWPFKVVSGVRIPYWVRDGEERLWVELPELERCAYYYLRMSEAPAPGPQVIHLRYSELVTNPLGTSVKLADWLRLEEGKRTRELLGSIRMSNKDLDRSILSRLSSEYREKILRESAMCE